MSHRKNPLHTLVSPPPRFSRLGSPRPSSGPPHQTDPIPAATCQPAGILHRPSPTHWSAEAVDAKVPVSRMTQTGYADSPVWAAKSFPSRRGRSNPQEEDTNGRGMDSSDSWNEASALAVRLVRRKEKQ